MRPIPLFSQSERRSASTTHFCSYLWQRKIFRYIIWTFLLEQNLFFRTGSMLNGPNNHWFSYLQSEKKRFNQQEVFIYDIEIFYLNETSPRSELWKQKLKVAFGAPIWQGFCCISPIWSQGIIFYRFCSRTLILILFLYVPPTHPLNFQCCVKEELDVSQNAMWRCVTHASTWCHIT